MQLRRYNRRPKSVEAFQITEELLRNPDCMDGRLIYCYSDNKWSVSSSCLPGISGEVGDYIVEDGDEVRICPRGEFEHTYDLDVKTEMARQHLTQKHDFDYLNAPG